MAKLIVESGGTSHEFVLSDVCRIGRDESNEIALDDAGSSRRHCRITRDGDGYVLEDLKSANGTFRNDERIDRVRLDDGDEIRVGGSTLRFVPSKSGEPGDEISLEEPAGEAAAPYEIVFARGERAGERVRIVGGRVTLGRRANNTVTLKDAKISGVHCEVVIEEGRPILRDLGSTNGTFLEGKRIDEIVLDHGDRVVVGDSEFVLADTKRAPPSLETGGGFDPSQTMVSIPTVKVVHDMTKTAPRSPMAAIGLVLLLVALGAAGWFYWSVQEKSTVAQAPPPAAGNMLGNRWSFEEHDDDPNPSAQWTSTGGGGGFDVVTGQAHSGPSAYVARVSGDTSVATMRAPIRVSARKYHISGYVRASDGAVGTLAAVFTNGDDPSYAIAMPVGGSEREEWQEVAADVVAPSGATNLALSVIATGPRGRVAFDDLSVIDHGVARPDVKVVNQFEFERAGEDLLVRRGDDDLLHVEAPIFVAQSTGEPDDANEEPGGAPVASESRQLPVASASRHLKDDSIRLPSGGSLVYASALTNDARSVTWRFDWKNASGLAGVRLPIVLLPAITDDAVGVMRQQTLEPFLESFEADDVTGLVLGRAGTRMRATFDSTVRIVGTREGDLFRLEVAPAVAAGRLTLAIQADFVEEKTNAAELLRDARQAERDQKLGTALSILERIRNEFPFDEAILADAESRTQEILRRRDQREIDLVQSIARAEFLASPDAYVEVEAEARGAAEAFAGTPSEGRFRAHEAELAKKRLQLVKSAREREAALLLNRLETELALGNTRTAQEIAADITQRFPDSDAAQRATNRLGDS